MRRALYGLAVALLALPALPADDKPKDEKPKQEEKKQTPKEQFNALTKDYFTQQQQIFTEARKVKGEEQQKLFQKYMTLSKDFAEKFYKLAEDNPKDPVATDALFWILQNGAQSSVFAKANDKVKALVADMPIADLRVNLNRVYGGNPALLEAVYNRAEKDAKDEKAADLLAWVARTGSYMPIGQKAIDRILEKYPEHPAVEQICQLLANSRSAKAADTLKQILEKSSQPRVKTAAAMALGEALANKVDNLGEKPDEADKVAADAEKYFTMVIDDLAKDNKAVKTQAERALKMLRTLRVGKVAPEITGPDLDEKEFKLSDYRGKVVLIDFWGHW